MSSISKPQYIEKITLRPVDDNRRLANLCGQCDENVQLIETRLQVEIRHRGHDFSVSGDSAAVKVAVMALQQLYVTQIDLLHNQRSGLKHVIHILKNIPQISFTFFDTGDVVRHPVVQSILNAYIEDEETQHTTQYHE